MLTHLIGYAQFGPQLIVTSDASLAEIVFAADLDGDGDNDVLSASRGDSKIAWYENTNGHGSFGPEQLIGILNQTTWTRAADLDGDSDIDVLAISSPGDLIVWYENIDGQGSFSQQRIISANVDLPTSAIVADLDGDGDNDVISASKNDNKVAWYENTNGLGDFGIQKIIDIVSSANAVYSSDLDGDGDLDVLATSAGNKRLLWYENLNGLGNFGSARIIVETPNFGGFVFVSSKDLDSDGDLDVISAEFGGNRVAWYENLDGLGNFGVQQIIDSQITKPLEIYSTDLDNDGDNDILSTSAVSALNQDSLIVWYENIDGQGSFGSPQIIIDSLIFAKSVFAIDIDGDGDKDVLSASQNDNTISWFENLTILGIEESVFNSLKLYPNPAKESINIDSSNIRINNLEIFTINGVKILTDIAMKNDIDVSHLNSGVYVFKFHTENGVIVKKIVKL